MNASLQSLLIIILIGQRNILQDGIVYQECLLFYMGNVFPVLLSFLLRYQLAIDADAAFVGLQKAEQQVQHGSLSFAGWGGNAQKVSLLQLHAKMPERRLLMMLK